MTLADLWETWRSAAGERIRSFTIVTTTPNEFVRGASRPHGCNPTYGHCGSANSRRTAAAQGAAGPCPSNEMICWPVSMRVVNELTTALQAGNRFGRTGVGI
jgi:hypothetical protein